QRDRYQAAKELASRTSATVVLKGAATIVYEGSGGWVSGSGNPWMATAGSGDVLTGVIAALLAQGLAPLQAAQLGAYLHARAGDTATVRKSVRISASELVEEILALIGQSVAGP